MRSLRPFIAGYLILCLALAGMVGLSPVLHQLIEHGGRGPLHTHYGVKEITVTDLPVGDIVCLNEHERAALHGEEPVRALRTHQTFKLPTAQVARLLHALADWFGGTESSPDKNGSQHEHHSLAQLLASGLVDQPLDAPLILHFSAPFTFRFFRTDALILDAGWDAQTAGRAPPVSLS